MVKNIKNIIILLLMIALCKTIAYSQDIIQNYAELSTLFDISIRNEITADTNIKLDKYILHKNIFYSSLGKNPIKYRLNYRVQDLSITTDNEPIRTEKEDDEKIDDYFNVNIHVIGWGTDRIEWVKYDNSWYVYKIEFIEDNNNNQFDYSIISSDMKKSIDVLMFYDICNYYNVYRNSLILSNIKDICDDLRKKFNLIFFKICDKNDIEYSSDDNVNTTILLYYKTSYNNLLKIVIYQLDTNKISNYEDIKNIVKYKSLLLTYNTKSIEEEINKYKIKNKYDTISNAMILKKYYSISDNEIKILNNIYKIK